MKQWEVLITEDVQNDLDNFVYYLLYRIVKNKVIVDRMFHDLQDLDKAMNQHLE